MTEHSKVVEVHRKAALTIAMREIEDDITVEEMAQIIADHGLVPAPKPEEKGKYPIDRPCSACSAGDHEMKYHDHRPAPLPRERSVDGKRGGGRA